MVKGKGEMRRRRARVRPEGPAPIMAMEGGGGGMVRYGSIRKVRSPWLLDQMGGVMFVAKVVTRRWCEWCRAVTYTPGDLIWTGF